MSMSILYYISVHLSGNTLRNKFLVLCHIIKELTDLMLLYFRLRKLIPHFLCKL